jgi:xylulose-5-phosphate/fructose-6-phosphate phosphoketolase
MGRMFASGVGSHGHKVEGFWRAHQVPVLDVKSNPEHLRIVEQWMRSYRPEELFNQEGTLVPELRALPPEGVRRMSANPHANGGKLRKALNLPAFRDYGGLAGGLYPDRPAWTVQHL